MTRSDKWREPRRACVQRYFDFRDEVRLKRIEVPDGSHVTFVLPMPKSWSEKERCRQEGMPHTQKPDIDNLAKAVLDSVYDEDNFIHDIRATKIWGRTGEIRVVPL